MKILFTSSECVPFIKTGGLADVVGALAPVLAKKGHDVRVVLPLYTAIDSKWQQQMEFQLHFDVQLGWRRQYCGVNMLKKDGVTYYFLDNKFYFGRPYVYGLGGDEYERYSFFCRAVLNALPLLDFKPDVIHAHDWQSRHGARPSEDPVRAPALLFQDQDRVHHPQPAVSGHFRH